MDNHRVVITGISTITGNSFTKEALWEQLMAKKIYHVPVPEIFEKNYTFKSKFYVPFPELKLEDYGFQAKFELLLENHSKIAVICAKLALQDAGLLNDHSIVDAGIILGTGLSSLKTACTSFVQHVAHHLNVAETNDFRYNRMVIPLTMPNSAAAWVSVLFGIKGESYTVNASCASGNYAIGQAYDKIKAGNLKVALCGGVECLGDKYGSMMRGFDMLGALTTSNDGLPQPFSKDRSGFLFSEGAGCVLILENLEHALARNANIYAELVDCRFNSDAYNIVQMEESGVQVHLLLKDLIGEHKVDYFNTHGTGTTNNDQIETTVIQQLFGECIDQPYINSTKSITGHSIGASAAIEAAVTAMTIKYGQIHPNLSHNNLEGLNLVTEPVKADINYAVSASYGFGGHNSAILLKKI